MIEALSEPSKEVHSIFFRLKLEISNKKMKVPESRAVLYFLYSLINKNKREERTNSKNEFPWAPIIGVQPSNIVSANIVPDINQGNPVNKIERKYSIIIQAIGKENITLIKELDLK